MSPYKMSLIIPFYNSASHVDNLFKSLSNETIFNDIEIICVNDGSTDGTEKKLEKYANKYKNVSIVSNGENLGTYDARRNGLKKATSKYISFMDSDDTIGPTFHEELYEKIISSGAPIVSSFHVMKILKNKKIIPAKEIETVSLKDNELVKITSEDKKARSLFVRVPWIWTNIFNRRVLRPYSLLPPVPLVFGEDDILYYSSMITAGRVLFIYTDSPYIYNQQYETNAMISNEGKRKICSQSFARSQILLDTFLMEFNHMDFLPLIKEKRKIMKQFLIKKYMDTFNTETFIDSKTKEILYSSTPQEKEAERIEIMNIINFLD